MFKRHRYASMLAVEFASLTLNPLLFFAWQSGLRFEARGLFFVFVVPLIIGIGANLIAWQFYDARE